MVMGFSDIKSKDAGPDFVAEKNGETFCFEVVTPTPRDSIRELIERGELTSEERDLVFRERLLSVTSAIKNKLKSLYIDLCNCLILICSIQHQMKVDLWTKNSYRLNQYSHASNANGILFNKSRRSRQSGINRSICNRKRALW